MHGVAGKAAGCCHLASGGNPCPAQELDPGGGEDSCGDDGGDDGDDGDGGGGGGEGVGGVFFYADNQSSRCIIKLETKRTGFTSGAFLIGKRGDCGNYFRLGSEHILSGF